MKKIFAILLTTTLAGSAYGFTQDISRKQADSIMEKYLLYYDSIQSQPLLPEDAPASRSWYPYSTYLLTGDTLFQDTAAFPGALRWSQNAYVYFIKSHLPVYGPTPECFFSIRRYTFTPFVHPGQPVFILTKPIAPQCNVVFLKGIIR